MVEKVSPMMREYLLKKEEYPDCILLYRLGDFYECFYDDAVKVSNALEITLTGKNCGLEERAPMCGVPYHAVDSYLTKLIEQGYKVAICEQLSEPKKGEIVKRDVVRIVTPGMLIETNILDNKKNNYVASVYATEKMCSIAYLDISTGDFKVIDIKDENYFAIVNDYLLRISPAEIISNKFALDKFSSLGAIAIGQLPKFYPFYEWAFQPANATKALLRLYNIQNLEGFDIKDKENCICSAGALIEYYFQTQKRDMLNIKTIFLEKNENYMYLDSNAIRNLELVSNLREGKRKGTLLEVLDYTKTSLGARELRKLILQPLQNEKEINDRLDAVEELYNNAIIQDALKNELSEICDIERLCSKVNYGTLGPRECLKLGETLSILPKIKEILKKCKSDKIQKIDNDIAEFDDLSNMIIKAIDPEAPLLARDGNFILQGFNADLDNLRNSKENTTQMMTNLLAVEIEQTGIKQIKIGYNRVFGYYFEIPKSFANLVPNRFVRKQTISNNERYITDELKSLEDNLLNSEEKSYKMEMEIYNYILDTLKKNLKLLLNCANAIASLDVLLSFAICSVKNNYKKPNISEKNDALIINDGRHPVVEVCLSKNEFIANDTLLDNNDNRIIIITGPNMAGKSTYMRQNALIVLMAHMGCFVPASSATLPIIDRIFTRVGASDDLAFGQSTFMVEMSEVSSVLHNATDKSLIILDEVGRGTSTYDGLSIAWSITEFLLTKLKAKTLFATHYHELTDLEGMLAGVKNYRISVKELNESIVFLRKIVRGGTNKSFGIEVAKLAGLPNEVIDRAKIILKKLEANESENLHEINEIEIAKDETNEKYQELTNVLKGVEINNITPFMALEKLDLLLKIINKG